MMTIHVCGDAVAVLVQGLAQIQVWSSKVQLIVTVALQCQMPPLFQNVRRYVYSSKEEQTAGEIPFEQGLRYLDSSEEEQTAGVIPFEEGRGYEKNAQSARTRDAGVGRKVFVLRMQQCRDWKTPTSEGTTIPKEILYQGRSSS